MKEFSWEYCQSIRYPKKWFALSYKFPNKRAYIVGGCNGEMKSYKNVEYYDVHDQKPHKLPNLNVARTSPGVILDPTRQKLIVFGGFLKHGSVISTMETLDLKSGISWQLLAIKIPPLLRNTSFMIVPLPN